jgi:hypothetical protein
MHLAGSHVYCSAQSAAPTRGLVAACLAAFTALSVSTQPTLGQTPANEQNLRRLPQVTPLVTLQDVAEDRRRVRQLRDTGEAPLGLFRSASSLNAPLGGDRRNLRIAIVPPAVTTVYNSELPYSNNDGVLWAGRGFSLKALAGVRVEWGPVRVLLAPELAHSANLDYFAFDIVPHPPGVLSFYANPWLTGPDWADVPLRFGDRHLRRLDPGQSSVAVRIGSAELGVATENEWWGPGIRNALILSNNAPGFPRVFLRTAEPIRTRAGTFAGRWLVGILSESPFFDHDVENDLRSISLLGLSWEPRWQRNLTIGAARAVFAPTSGWGSALGDFAQVFADVGIPSTEPGERDQLFSLFFRWVFPADGFELFGEWARAEQPVSLSDFLTSPNHSQAYTLGLQWVGGEIASSRPRLRGRVRLESEFTFLEQSTTFRFRPIGSWYTSPRVVQGYTHEGQTLGAAVGPGGSGQYVGIDYLARSWQAGAFVERIRSLEDAHSVDPGSSWCNHDVSFLPGASAAMRTPFGTVSARYSSGWRLNTYFLAMAGFQCPGGPTLDVRSNSLSVSFSPTTWR